MTHTDDLDTAWERLIDTLAEFLARMDSADGSDHLAIELPDADDATAKGATPYAQFAGFGDGTMVRAEIAGNAYLRPEYRLGEHGCAFLTETGWSGNQVAGPVEERNWYVEVALEDTESLASVADDVWDCCTDG